jgi:hypothetical protein
MAAGSQVYEKVTGVWSVGNPCAKAVEKILYNCCGNLIETESAEWREQGYEPNSTRDEAGILSKHLWFGKS